MTLEELLRSLPPPAKPLPMPLTTQTPAPGPMPLGPAPELPPTAPLAPLAPLDMNFVNSYAGAPPVAPTQRQPGTLEKIAAVLSGVALGPQYGMALREQREQPFRDYQRQNEQYQDRRARGLEIAERRAEREAEAANRMNEAVYEREYRAWLQKNGARDDEAKERMRQAFVLERDARRARLEQAKELEREQRQKEVEARQIENQYFGLSKNRALSKELGAYWSGLKTSLSPAAAKLDAQLQRVGEVRMGRAAGVGGTGGGRGVSNAAMRALANFNGALEEVKGAVSRGDVRGERTARRKLDVMFGRLSQFPRDIEAAIGTGGWPYAKLRGGAPAPAPGQQPQGPTRSIQQIRQLAQQAGISEAEAIQRAQQAGYTITQ